MTEHKSAIRHRIRQLLIAAGLVGAGTIAGTTWMLPGGTPSVLATEITIERAFATYPATEKAEHPLQLWVMRIPFSDPCKVKIDAKLLAGVNTHVVAHDSTRWAQEHVIVIAGEPWKFWRKVPADDPGFELQHVNMTVTGPGGESFVVRWP